MRSQLARLACGLTVVLLLVGTLSTFVAEGAIPTLQLTDFARPQGWLLLSVTMLLIGAWQRDASALWGGERAAPAPGPSSLCLMTYTLARYGRPG